MIFVLCMLVDQIKFCIVLTSVFHLLVEEKANSVQMSFNKNVQRNVVTLCQIWFEYYCCCRRKHLNHVVVVSGKNIP